MFIKIIKPAICAFFIVQTFTAFSQKADYKNEFGFRSDNDSYLAQGQDRYYTNGLFITFRHATDQSKLNRSIHKKIWEIEAGQRIYNAQSGSIPDIAFVDRPFAGYLYGGFNMAWLYDSENSLKANLQVGTIGRSSLAQDAQEFLHKSVGFYELEGWQYQVNDEVGLNTSLEYMRFLKRSGNSKADFSAIAYVNVGTTYSGGGAGLIIRTGRLNPLYNSAINNSRVVNRSQGRLETGPEFFFFIKPMVNFVAYDATVQGGLLSNDKGPVTYDVKTTVISSEIGAMYAKRRWTADFSMTFKSKEIKSTAKSHQYGSISLYYKFN